MFDFILRPFHQKLTGFSLLRFKHYHVHQVMLPYSGFLLSVIPIYLLFGLLDYQHITEHAWVATLSRVFLSILCIVVLITLRRYASKYLELAELFLVLTVYVSIITIGKLAMTQGNFDYQSGGVLVMVYIGALSRMPFKLSLFGLSLMLLSYLLVIAPDRIGQDYAEELDRISIFFAVFLISLVASLRRDSETRKSFQQFSQIRSQQLRLRASQKKLALQTVTDPLTELKNRLYLTKNGPQIEQSAQHTNKPLSVLMIDIDNFKSINDTYGHQVGDNVIYGVAQIIRQHCGRYTGMNVRYGGEEFLSVFQCFNEQQLCQIAEKILDDVPKLYWPNTNLRVTISIGASIDVKQRWDLNELISHGDKALYRAKQNGKNQIQLITQ
ncbi:GGDEF domain-containing protein [Shewanella sp. MMG014]|uniref:GGDEF domain-containing protein n=1 Tax=Shewanella sp. MMG014 TaxID=2822691 RepID=UPI001B360320|nr:GGDEF domain-containing protein [Shewanella sp. MMG014]MBQ4891012.1 GGDEF domain-containing protein [Shewanella sp. MMG014]